MHHELLVADVLQLVADRARSELVVVEAFVTRLELHASMATPPGSIENFNVDAVAARWRRDPDELARIRAVLEDDDIGWLDQDNIVSWWGRNPEHEDRTAADRQQRLRDRIKLAKQMARAERLGLSTESVTVRHGASRRDSVTVTPRAEQIINEEVAAEAKTVGSKPPAATSESSAVPTQSGDSGDIEIWLALEGKRIVAERCRSLPSRAWLDITRWRKELGDDIVTLATLIADTDLMGLECGRFADRIRSEIVRVRHEKRGPPLPFTPTAIKGSRHG